MAWETIDRTDHGDGVIRISLDRPETHNAQNTQLINELDKAIKEVEAEENSRVIILDGNGPSFSSGHDLSMIERDWKGEGWSVEERLKWEEDIFWSRCMTIKNVDIPTIAQVHGSCGAAGLMLVAVCDLIMTAESAEFWNPVNRMASNGLELLLEPWEVGVRKAKELLWTGDRISGTEAEQLGMANHAVPEENLDTKTLTLAHKIAQTPPFSVKLSKDSFTFAERQMGKLDAWRYHFMTHQLGHASDEWEEWHAEASEIALNQGIPEFVHHRDKPYDMED